MSIPLCASFECRIKSGPHTAKVSIPSSYFDSPASPGSQSPSIRQLGKTSASRFDVSVLPLIPSDCNIDELHGYLRGPSASSSVDETDATFRRNIAQARMRESQFAMRNTPTGPRWPQQWPNVRAAAMTRSWSSPMLNETRLPEEPPSIPDLPPSVASTPTPTPRGRTRRSGTPKSGRLTADQSADEADDGASVSSVRRRTRSQSMSRVSIKKALEKLRSPSQSTLPLPAKSRGKGERDNKTRSNTTDPFMINSHSMTSLGLHRPEHEGNRSMGDLPLSKDARSVTDLSDYGDESFSSLRKLRRGDKGPPSLSGVGHLLYGQDTVQSPMSYEASDGDALSLRQLPIQRSSVVSSDQNSMHAPSSNDGLRSTTPAMSPVSMYGKPLPGIPQQLETVRYGTALADISGPNSADTSMSDRHDSPVQWRSPAPPPPRSTSGASRRVASPTTQMMIASPISARTASPSAHAVSTADSLSRTQTLSPTPSTRRMSRPALVGPPPPSWHTPWSQEPVPEPVPEPMPAPVSEPVSEPVPEPVLEPMPQPTSEHMEPLLASYEREASVQESSHTCSNSLDEHASDAGFPSVTAQFLQDGSNLSHTSAGSERVSHEAAHHEAANEEANRDDSFSQPPTPIVREGDTHFAQTASASPSRRLSTEEQHNSLIVQIEDAFQRIMDIAVVSQAANVPLPQGVSTSSKRINASPSMPRRVGHAANAPDAPRRVASSSAARTLRRPSLPESAAPSNEERQGVLAVQQASSEGAATQERAAHGTTPFSAAKTAAVDASPTRPELHSQLEQFAAQQANLRGTIETSKAEILELRRNIRQFRNGLQQDASAVHDVQPALRANNEMAQAHQQKLRESIASMDDLDRRLATMLHQESDGDAQQWLLQGSYSTGRNGNVSHFDRSRTSSDDHDEMDADWSLTDEQLPDAGSAPWYAQLHSSTRHSGRVPSASAP